MTNTPARSILFPLIAAAFFTTVITGCDPDDGATPDAPVACFTFSRDTIFPLDTFSVSAACTQNATSFSWSAPYATPHTDTGAAVSFYAYQSGKVDITLTATNAEGNHAVTKSIFVKLPDAHDYAGTYTCNDSCDTHQNGPYTLTITASDPFQVVLTGLGPNPFDGEVQTGNVTITQEPMGSGYFSASGSLSIPIINVLDIQSTYTESGTVLYSCWTNCTRN